jgi:predicted  nucleic acid-binding Zn-ribbon protein
VLERVWRATVEADSRVVSLATLEELGGAKAIVERHLLEALAGLDLREQDIASDCFQFLVSRERTKRAQAAGDLAAWTRRREADVTAVLGALCTAESGRILRAIAPAADTAQGTSYELFHDVLAEPVLAWRRRHEAARDRRRLVRVGAAALALVAIFAALAGWALAERHHTQKLLDARNASNAALSTRYAALLKQTAAARARNLRIERHVTVLAAQNHSLTGQTAALVKTRNGLTVETRTLRVQDVALARGLRKLNGENTALAKEITALQRTGADLDTELSALQDEQAQLAQSAGVLKKQQASLDAQAATLEAENKPLELKAQELGRAATAVSQGQQHLASATQPPPAVVARQYDVPGDTAGSDALRQRVESLGEKLLALRVARARVADEEGFYTKANGLLVQQRAALRLENARLAVTLATVKARNGVLVANTDLAKAQYATLAKQRATQTAANARATKRVAAERRAEAKLQAGAISRIGSLGDTQDEIATATAEHTQLVTVLAGPVGKLAAAARNPKQDSKLAGLLAVLAYRLTPYAPSDPAHPDVYNALWLTLNRLDPTAAHNLIAPSSRSTALIGTTTSAKLKQAVCERAAGTLTRDEWARFLPAGAPYSRSAATPCG